MKHPELERINDQQFALSGELTMHNVPQVSRDTAALLETMSGEVVIDLSKVVRADSAGLALLIDWLRVARRRNFNLSFERLPEQLMQIARVSELHTVLPISHQA